MLCCRHYSVQSHFVFLWFQCTAYVWLWHFFRVLACLVWAHRVYRGVVFVLVCPVLCYWERHRNSASRFLYVSAALFTPDSSSRCWALFRLICFECMLDQYPFHLFCAIAFPMSVVSVLCLCRVDSFVHFQCCAAEKSTCVMISLRQWCTV